MDAPCISAKTGLNVDEVLERIVTDFNPPNGDENKPLKCLIFASTWECEDIKNVLGYNIEVKAKSSPQSNQVDDFNDIPDEVDVDRLEFEIESREYYSFMGDKTTNSFDMLLL